MHSCIWLAIIIYIKFSATMKRIIIKMLEVCLNDPTSNKVIVTNHNYIEVKIVKNRRTFYIAVKYLCQYFKLSSDKLLCNDNVCIHTPNYLFLAKSRMLS